MVLMVECGRDGHIAREHRKMELQMRMKQTAGIGLVAACMQFHLGPKAAA